MRLVLAQLCPPCRYIGVYNCSVQLRRGFDSAELCRFFSRCFCTWQTPSPNCFRLSRRTKLGSWTGLTYLQPLCMPPLLAVVSLRMWSTDRSFVVKTFCCAG